MAPLQAKAGTSVLARAKRDPAFRAALLNEGIELLKAGDIQIAEAILRDYLDATKQLDR